MERRRPAPAPTAPLKKSHNRQFRSTRCSDKGEGNGNTQKEEQDKQAHRHRTEKRRSPLRPPKQDGRIQETSESREVPCGRSQTLSQDESQKRPGRLGRCEPLTTFLGSLM